MARYLFSFINKSLKKSKKTGLKYINFGFLRSYFYKKRKKGMGKIFTLIKMLKREKEDPYIRTKNRIKKNNFKWRVRWLAFDCNKVVAGMLFAKAIHFQSS